MTDVEILTQSIGRQLFSIAKKKSATIVSPYAWKERAIMWFARDDNLRTQMLRFVDVFPSLHSIEDKKQHMRDYFVRGLQPVPFIFLMTDSLSRLPLGAKVVASVAEWSVKNMGQHFMVGPTPEEIVRTINKLQREGVDYTLDVLGEAVLSESEADKYMQKYISLIQQLSSYGCSRIDFSLKLSALYSQFDPIDPEGSIAIVKKRLRPILRAARVMESPVTFDAEQCQYRDLTVRIFMEVLDEEEFRSFENAGIAVHTYFLDSEARIKQLISWARHRSIPILMRLVKGAYWDWETMAAKQKAWPVPVYEERWQTDACYERATTLVLENCDVIRLAIASHNIRSIAQAMAKARVMGIPKDRLEFQLLLGIGDFLKKAILKMGYPAKVYMASGELLPGMSFLVRRIIENTSQTGFLFQSMGANIPLEELLANPEEDGNKSTLAA